MFGCVPSAVKTMGAYVPYSCSAVTLQYDSTENKFVKASMQDVFHHIKIFFVYVFILGAMFSCTLQSHYQPFGRFEGQAWHHMNRIVDPAQFFNNLVLALIFQTFITTVCEGLITATVVFTGCKCEAVMENPIFYSTSPSEFWGKRWNRVIHSSLKRGVYIPLRKHHVSRIAAAWMTFVASGIFHDWIVSFVFRPRPYELESDGSCLMPHCYQVPPIGGSIAFFVWNSIFVTLEFVVGGTMPMQRFIQTVPSVVRTILLLCLALPVAHWFCEPYVVSNFFDHARIGFPLIKEVAYD